MCFHADQAYIFERSDKVAKTHHGVQTEFLRLTRHDRRINQDLRRFLDRAYDIKSVADYFTGPHPVTSRAEAIDAVPTARRFVDHFEALVPVEAALPDSGEPS